MRGDAWPNWSRAKYSCLQILPNPVRKKLLQEVADLGPRHDFDIGGRSDLREGVQLAQSGSGSWPGCFLSIPCMRLVGLGIGVGPN